MDRSLPMLLERFRAVRARSLAICAPLLTEDTVIQTMPDVGPPKWHLGHVTWYLEAMLLARFEREHRPHHPGYAYVYNSYYEVVGDRVPRAERGLLSRPSLADVRAYRAAVDERIERLFEQCDDLEAAMVLELGTHHEEQHQELLLTDIKHILLSQPLRPTYTPEPSTRFRFPSSRPIPAHAAGIVRLGSPSGDGFAFDNERPVHDALIERHGQLAPRPVTNGEFQQFIDDAGYRDARLWLSDGWAAVHNEGWTGPLYWRDGSIDTLHGTRAIDPDEPVCHVSFYEADAFARWAGARLPSEAEWESVARAARPEPGQLFESGRYHPLPPPAGTASLLGGVWEWTRSPYLPYPGFEPFPGELAEYNGKFMMNQIVLRGGSCFTPRDHLRVAYRNFFQPEKRWQMTGFRLVRDVTA
jgi:ergothioneine biosynthesis protein EgtB